MIDLPTEKAFDQWRFRRNVKIRKKLYSKLSKMLSNSVPVQEALTDLKKRRIEQFSANDIQAKAITDWLQRISGGTFAKALSGWIPHDEQSIIAGGEQSGRTPEALMNLVEILEAKQKIKSTIVKALTYPVLIITLVVLALAGFGGYLVPFYSNLAPNIQWYGQAESVVNITTFFSNNLFWIFLTIISLIVGFIWSLNHWVDGFRVRLDRFGPWAIFSMLQGVSWLIAFASLIQAGIPVKDALKTTSVYASPWLKTRINAIYQRLGDYNLGEAMARTGYNFPDKEVINDLETYSKYSGFDLALKALADEWLKESIDVISVKVSKVNWIGILIAASVLIYLAVGLRAIGAQMQENLGQGF